jgi:hypothetical protein
MLEVCWQIRILVAKETVSELAHTVLVMWSTGTTHTSWSGVGTCTWVQHQVPLVLLKQKQIWHLWLRPYWHHIIHNVMDYHIQNKQNTSTVGNLSLNGFRVKMGAGIRYQFK